MLKDLLVLLILFAMSLWVCIPITRLIEGDKGAVPVLAFRTTILSVVFVYVFTKYSL